MKISLPVQIAGRIAALVWAIAIGLMLLGTVCLSECAFTVDQVQL